MISFLRFRGRPIGLALWLKRNPHEGSKLYNLSLHPYAEENAFPLKKGNTLPSHLNVLPLGVKGQKGNSQLPHLIAELYSGFHKNLLDQGDGSAYNGFPAAHPIFLKNNLICFVRAFLLQNSSEAPERFASTSRDRSLPLFLREEKVGLIRLLFHDRLIPHRPPSNDYSSLICAESWKGIQTGRMNHSHAGEKTAARKGRLTGGRIASDGAARSSSRRGEELDGQGL